MMFAPAAIAEHKMTAEDLRRDSRNCVRTGPCGIGEKAVYLNSFFVDRRYYVMWQDIGRVFKRVAMSRGGFTGKGVFGSIPYLVVLLKDGTERQCNFKYEDEVDLFLSLVRSRHPEIPTMSEKAQARMEEERAREEARYVKDLTPQAQASMEELRRARAYLDREPEIPAFLSVTAKEKPGTGTLRSRSFCWRSVLSCSESMRSSGRRDMQCISSSLAWRLFSIPCLRRFCPQAAITAAMRTAAGRRPCGRAGNISADTGIPEPRLQLFPAVLPLRCQEQAAGRIQPLRGLFPPSPFPPSTHIPRRSTA